MRSNVFAVMFARLFRFGSVEALARLINWLMLLVFPLFIPATVYGELSLFLSFLGICAAFSAFGLNRAVLRLYGTERRDPAVLTAVTLIQCIVAGAFLALAVFLYFSGYRLPGLTNAALPIGLILCAVLQNILALGTALSRVEQSQSLVVLFRLLPQVFLALALCAAAVFYADSWAYVAAVAFAFTPFVAVQVVLAIRRGVFSEAISGELLKNIVSLCWPFVFITAAGFIHAQIDRVLLAHYLSLRDVGIYSLYYTLGSSINFVFAIMMFALEPQVYSANNDRAASERISAIGSLQLIIGLSICVLIIGFGESLLPLFYDASYLGAFETVIILLAAHVIHPIYLMGNMGLMFRQKTAWLMWGMIPSALCNVALNMLLIPMHGIQGAAIATLCSYLLLNVIIYGAYLYHSGNALRTRSHYFYIVSILFIIPLAALSGSKWISVVAFLSVAIAVAQRFARAYFRQDPPDLPSFFLRRVSGES